MSDVDYNDHGYDGGHEGGYDAGHQEYNLDQLHAAQGAEHDQFTDYNQYAAEHADESDVHFANFHNVEASDGHGAYYSETDATEYDAHEANYDSVNSENYTNIQHDSNFSELDHLRQQFEADYLHADGGHGALTAK